jgi:CBS domain-containing protein
MKIKDRPEYRSKGVVLSFGKDTMVQDAVAVMSEKNYGAVVIIDAANKPLGIVTERDLMRRVLAKQKDPKATPLAEIMTTDLKVAKAEDNLLDWLRIMSNERFRHLPIVDDGGVLVAMMSQGDFVSYTWPELIQRLGDQSKATFIKMPSLISMILSIIAFAIAAGVLVTRNN